MWSRAGIVLDADPHVASSRHGERPEPLGHVSVAEVDEPRDVGAANHSEVSVKALGAREHPEHQPAAGELEFTIEGCDIVPLRACASTICRKPGSKMDMVRRGRGCGGLKA